MCSKIAFLILGCLVLGSFCAPHNLERIETDPELIGDYFEGDMDVAFLRNGIISPTRHWPNATVYYQIDEQFDQAHVAHLERAMRLIENTSCVRFVPATEENDDYVLIAVSSGGCNSNVGKIGGQQILRLTNDQLGTKCFRLGVMQHELLHTLGFFHQQSSTSRDNYIEVIEENIMEDKMQAFRKLDERVISDFNAEYDYGSIMHYGPMAFSKNGKPTIVALDPEGQSKMGQRLAMSSADIMRLNTMYNCPI